jgi:hypothetical protein
VHAENQDRRARVVQPKPADVGRDLLLISLPPDSKEIKQTCLN